MYVFMLPKQYKVPKVRCRRKPTQSCWASCKFRAELYYIKKSKLIEIDHLRMNKGGDEHQLGCVTLEVWLLRKTYKNIENLPHHCLIYRMYNDVFFSLLTKESDLNLASLFVNYLYLLIVLSSSNHLPQSIFIDYINTGLFFTY